MRTAVLNGAPQYDPQQLLAEARQGSDNALGKLLEHYRPYLGLIARLKADQQMRRKIDDSDLVQDTCLSAHKDFARFRGSTEKEFTAWLREIMAHAAANLFRDHQRQKRDIRNERHLYTLLSQSSQRLERALSTTDSSPSLRAERRERAVLLANALAELPDDYREVIVLRELEGKSVSEVAEAMERTPNAIQKLWARAVVQLRGRLQRLSDLS
jgi:RNA polymerase sigma-70 factor (ECF subfamily)